MDTRCADILCVGNVDEECIMWIRGVWETYILIRNVLCGYPVLWETCTIDEECIVGILGVWESFNIDEECISGYPVYGKRTF